MHQSIEPSILYFGTPVVLISSLNEDGTTNISPISSAWWLGWSCMLGFDGSSKTVDNLKRNGECVINLTSNENVQQVDRLAKLTGSKKVPIHKKALGYRSSADKFQEAKLTPQASEIVQPHRIKECPIQLEGKVANIHQFANSDSKMSVAAFAIEVTIERVHAQSSLTCEENANRIDPDKWKPLIMNFRHFHGLTERLNPSRLAEGSEEIYAPWKQRGVRGVAVKSILKIANLKYR